MKPDDNWRWYYDEEHDRRCSISPMVCFFARASLVMLTPDALCPTGFCVDDAALYFPSLKKNAGISN
ncbi:cell division protein ZapC [Salmonella enterica subsp. enterica]|nr:cell division protein ZapC [Salmonella enterica subsp. enterica]